jgi:dimethylhistidine N-methyltransferase
MSVPFSSGVLTASRARGAFQHDVLVGLSQSPKRLPCKYLYDRRGSMLFDAICEQPEYYLTRTEQQIVRQHSREMIGALGPDVVLVEFGSGSSIKTRYLLEQLEQAASYVPVDISREHLMATASRLKRDFRDLRIWPVCADFTAEFCLPPQLDSNDRRVVYFPGSTIGNFEPTGAVRLLNGITRLCGTDGGLLIGVDLLKDPLVIERAYNDAAGVTAEFNLNLLMRINRELGGNFDLDQFDHLAFYDERFQRVDLRLISKRPQRVQISGATFDFAADEPIHTEHSHKYTIDRFARMASEAGWKLERQWTDQDQYFGVLYFVRHFPPEWSRTAR